MLGMIWMIPSAACQKVPCVFYQATPQQRNQAQKLIALNLDSKLHGRRSEGLQLHDGSAGKRFSVIITRSRPSTCTPVTLNLLTPPTNICRSKKKNNRRVWVWLWPCSIENQSHVNCDELSEESTRTILKLR